MMNKRTLSDAEVHLDPAIPAQPPPNTGRVNDTRPECSNHVYTTFDATLGKDATRMEKTESVHSEHQSKKATIVKTKMSNQSNIGDDEGQDNLTNLDDEYMDDFVQPRTLREFNMSRAGDVRGVIRLPRIVGQQPNFNLGVINIVQQNTFHGLDHEDPHAHLQTFLECCTTIKTNAGNCRLY